MSRSAIRILTHEFIQHTSKYDQTMRKLSCKIFNDFYIPELDRKDMDYGIGHPVVCSWFNQWHGDFRTWERNQDKPIDTDPNRNHKYFPPHPQIRALTNTLREYGLFRDEHRDFNEEMKQIAIKRGHVFRERRGPIKREGKKKK